MERRKGVIKAFSDDCLLVRLLSTLYGMIEHGDMTYLELSRVVRWMDRSVRKGIYKDFMD